MVVTQGELAAIGWVPVPVYLHGPTGRWPDRSKVNHMSDEHTKGAVNQVKGKVEETAGKVTGNKQQEAHGVAKQVQGDAQKGLGDVQDAVRGTGKP